jgi:hypothetical protein
VDGRQDVGVDGRQDVGVGGRAQPVKPKGKCAKTRPTFRCKQDCDYLVLAHEKLKLAGRGVLGEVSTALSLLKGYSNPTPAWPTHTTTNGSRLCASSSAEIQW